MKISICICIFLMTACTSKNYYLHDCEEEYLYTNTNSIIKLNPIVEPSGRSKFGSVVPDTWLHKDVIVEAGLLRAHRTFDPSIFINPYSGQKIRTKKAYSGQKLRDPRTNEIFLIP